VTKLLNVRLNEQDARIVEDLRSEGVEISSVVRDALRAEHARRRKSKRPLDVAKIMEEIYRRHPTPPDYKPRAYNVHNAKEARQAIVAKLKRKRA
jgi:hypothetical protein